MTEQFPKTLIQAVTYFSDHTNCVDFVRRVCWPNGVVTCNRCQSTEVTALATREIWQCRDCRKQFSLKVGTIFEKSPLPLSKWLPAFWLLSSAKNGISSYELHRAIGVTQKTAWFMLHRIREAMRTGTFKKLTGTIETDETYIGGDRKNRHAKERAIYRRGYKDHKTGVIAMVERGGRVTGSVLDNHTSNAIQSEVRKNIATGSVLYTDEYPAYTGLRGEYKHSTVNHSEDEFVRGDVHTNTIEGFFSLLKRTLKGTYIHVAPFHLDRYIDEQAYRYKTRKSNDSNRFENGMSGIVGRRLTYAQLTGKVAL